MGVIYHGDTPAPRVLVGSLAVGSYVGTQPVDERQLTRRRVVGGALRPDMAATTGGCGVLSLGLRRSNVWVRDAGVAEPDALTTAEPAEVCVAAFSGYQRGRVFTAR